MQVQDNYSVPNNRNKKKIKILLMIFCILIIAVGVSVYELYGIITSDNYGSLSMIDSQSGIDSGGISNTLAPSKSETLKYNGKTYERNENIVNLLFLGIDSNSDREERMKGYRSDMVLVCAVDTAEKKATLLSIPRDTYTTMYKIDASTGSVKSTVHNRINAAYSFGGGPRYFGAENSMACVQMFLQRECELDTSLPFTLNIPVYLYASIDMEGIAPVASSVGGIEVDLKYTIPGVGKKGETVLLQGSKAENYLFDRHNTPGGDLGRASKEQEFMIKLAKKIKSMGAADIILNLYDELQKYVDTNLNTTQMLDFAKILSKVDIDSIETYTIPGKTSTGSGPSYYFSDEEETLELLLSVYYNEVS